MDNLDYEKYFLYALTNNIKPVSKDEFFKICKELNLDNYEKAPNIEEFMTCT